MKEQALELLTLMNYGLSDEEISTLMDIEVDEMNVTIKPNTKRDSKTRKFKPQVKKTQRTPLVFTRTHREFPHLNNRKVISSYGSPDGMSKDLLDHLWEEQLVSNTVIIGHM